MRPIIGITMGDPSGIGPEIALKALKSEKVYKECIPVIIGDFEALNDANIFTGTNFRLNEIKNPSQAKGEIGTIDFINLGYLQKGSWEYKKVCKISGEASFNYVKRGIELALENEIAGVITGPINKEAINLAGYKYAGHTEIFGELTKTKDFAMVLMSDNLRVIHVTTHVSMRKACDLITEERVYKVIKLAEEALTNMGIENGKIGVAGFNAHASENGLFGDEEARGIIPAISKAQAEGVDVEGPVPPDTVFVKALSGQYDIVVAMYHDQGHIPLKILGFNFDPNKKISVKGVNCTVGLPVIRSSVDHGTAFDRAGQGIASEESMIDAIEVGVRMAKKKFGL